MFLDKNLRSVIPTSMQKRVDGKWPKIYFSEEIAGCGGEYRSDQNKLIVYSNVCESIEDTLIHEFTHHMQNYLGYIDKYPYKNWFEIEGRFYEEKIRNYFTQNYIEAEALYYSTKYVKCDTTDDWKDILTA